MQKKIFADVNILAQSSVFINIFTISIEYTSEFKSQVDVLGTEVVTKVITLTEW